MLNEKGEYRMKAKIIAGLGIVVLAVALCFTLKPKSFDKQFEKVMKDMNTYILQGDMEITKGEDVKTYALEVGYQKVDDSDYFKVSILDKELNQEQVILRNAEGVFVVTPSLNQVFKFEGDWPLNSPKPYLLQSMVDIVNQEDTTISKEEDGYLISSPVVYPNNKNYVKEELMFDKDAKIQWVQIFNQDNNVELKIVFQKADYNKEINKDYFSAPTSLETPTSAPVLSDEDLPMYPSAVFNAQLSGKNTVSSNGTTKHMLQFSGEKSFTVVQSVRESAENTQTVIMPGQIVDSLDVIGFYDGNHMSAIANGIEFTVFSDDLSPDEMMSVITSMQVAVMK